MSEPTGVVNFGDLITEVAYYLGIADYAVDGTPSIPTDANDLAICKKHVNDGIRMFISDAPKQGWRWLNPVASLTLWPDIALSTATVTAGVYDMANDETTLTATAASFYPSMEAKTLTVTTVVAPLVVKSYVSPVAVIVYGDHSTIVAKTFSILSGGNFTLPQTFGGQYTGAITYAANTNRGVQPVWREESLIRSRRENTNDETGTPYEFAVRLWTDANAIAAAGSKSRPRWELITWRKPDSVFTVEFPYTLYFTQLTALTDTHPAPYSHDESVLAACKAVAERETNGVMDGTQNAYYQSRLASSYQIDNLSAPRAMGYFGNPQGAKGPPIRNWRDNFYQRPTVGVNP